MRIGLAMELTSTCLLLEVWDASAGTPVLREPDPIAECGRGLALVDMLGSAWGQRTADGGKVVWCELEGAKLAREATTNLIRSLPAIMSRKVYHGRSCCGERISLKSMAGTVISAHQDQPSPGDGGGRGQSRSRPVSFLAGGRGCGFGSLQR
jgi:hypothetical protein